MCFFFFFQAEDGIRDVAVTGVQTCALPICPPLSVLCLVGRGCIGSLCLECGQHACRGERHFAQAHAGGVEHGDRKSTRLNSSHGYISYAVFCLKKKKYKQKISQYLLMLKIVC